MRVSKKSSGRLLKRDSSADTSKDIDDIEDFEFDGGVDELLHDDEDELLHPDELLQQDELLRQDELLHEDDGKRCSTLMQSPDLAYGSLDPSADEFSK